jgi:hypothetical protein
MDNTDEIFLMNKQIYTKLASYNNKYHLYTSNCKDRISNTCKEEGDILDIEYQALEQDMNKLLELLNNNKIIQQQQQHLVDLVCSRNCICQLKFLIIQIIQSYRFGIKTLIYCFIKITLQNFFP